MTHQISTCLYAFYIITLFFYTGCSNDPNENTTASNHIGQGWYAYNSGNYTQAILNFERALNADPEFADAHNGVGWSNLSLSLPLSLAQESFQNAVRYDPTNGDAWVGLANVLYMRHKDKSDFESAIRAIDNALAGEKRYLYRHDYDSDSSLFALKASCYFYLGDYEKSLQELETLLKTDNNHRTAILLQKLINE